MTRNGQRWNPSPGLLLVFFTAAISGVSTFVNAYAVQGTNPDAFLTARNALVAAMLLPLVLILAPSSRTKLARRDWLRLSAIGLIGGAIPFLLFFRGIQMATAAGGAATASFGYRTLFLMATVLAVVVLRERVSKRMLLATVALLGGNALLLSLSAPVWTDGTALVLAATALWAAEYTMSKRALRDLPSGTVALGRMGFGAVFLVAYLAASNQLGAMGGLGGASLPWILVSAVLLLAFVSTWYAGLKHVDLGVATSVLVLAFPITWALQMVVVPAKFDLVAAVGAVVVVLGVLLAVGLTTVRDSIGAAIDRIVRAARRAG